MNLFCRLPACLGAGVVMQALDVRICVMQVYQVLVLKLDGHKTGLWKPHLFTLVVALRLYLHYVVQVTQLGFLFSSQVAQIGIVTRGCRQGKKAHKSRESDWNRVSPICGNKLDMNGTSTNVPVV